MLLLNFNRSPCWCVVCFVCTVTRLLSPATVHETINIHIRCSMQLHNLLQKCVCLHTTLKMVRKNPSLLFHITYIFINSCNSRSSFMLSIKINSKNHCCCEFNY